MACRSEMTKGRAEGLSPELVTLPGASRVRSVKTPEFQRLTYRVKMVYPARPAIEEISRQLASRGWRPVRNNFFNRGEQSDYVSGWAEYKTASIGSGPARYLCRWWAQWVHDDGSVVDYHLFYRSRAEQFTNRSVLDVTAAKMTKATANAMLQQNPTNVPPQPLQVLGVGTPPNWQIATSITPSGAYVPRAAD